jgi:hypothetical protein
VKTTSLGVVLLEDHETHSGPSPPVTHSRWPQTHSGQRQPMILEGKSKGRLRNPSKRQMRRNKKISGFFDVNKPKTARRNLQKADEGKAKTTMLSNVGSPSCFWSICLKKMRKLDSAVCEDLSPP